MLESLQAFFSGQGFMPHGYCLLWRPEILWLHAGSDALIALAYFMIPLTILYFIRHLPTLPFIRVFLLFAAFILLCGATHVISLWALWEPVYPLQGMVKLATGAVSLVTAVALIPLVPRALSLKTPAQLERVVESRTAELERSNDSLSRALELHKKTERALRASEQRVQQQLADNQALAKRLQLLTDALPALISYVDTGHRYRFVNAGFLRQFGLSREDVLGENVQAVLGDEVYRAIEPQVRAALGGVPQQHDISLNTADGVKHFAASYVPELTTEGATAGYYALLIDITARKQIEGALREHRAKLERSNRDSRQFAYIASHDLREPLRTVSSYLKLLYKRYQGALDDEAKEFIDIAVKGSQRMSELIDGLLDFSRVDSDGAEAVPVELGPLSREVLTDLSQMIDESDAEISHDPLPAVMVDPVQCRQLLQNLIANALKFRSQAPPRVHLSARREGERWVVSIRDNGIGIKANFQQRIFQIFQRLHTREEYPGTGLGLALCQRIVERHGGRIWVESEPGAGATFLFDLPAVEPGAR